MSKNYINKNLFCLTTFIILLSQCFITFSQSKVQFIEMKHDFGTIVEGTKAEKSFLFLNVGIDTLRISNFTTGDGGALPIVNERIVPPGDTGEVIIKYDTRRIGPFTKCGYVTINDTLYILRITGKVIYKPTSISVYKDSINVGDIDFDNVYTVTFPIFVTGKEGLHIEFKDYAYSEWDLLWLKVHEDSLKQNKKSNESEGFKEGSELTVTASFINNYGNVGLFSRKLLFVYNANDTLILNISGNYLGDSIPNKIITKVLNGSIIYYYSDNKLAKIELVSSFGVISSECLFENSNCYLERSYHWRDGYKMKEEKFKDGIRISDEEYRKP